MDAIKMHDRALDATTAIVARVSPKQFGEPTPCADFDVRALLGHMVGGNYTFVEIAKGNIPDPSWRSADFVGDDHVASYRSSAEAVAQAWSDAALLGQTVHLPFGDFPGQFAIGIHSVEALVHGWDLAKATGQTTTLDPELVQFAWENVKDLSEDFRGPGKPFGPKVDVRADAPPTDRLVAWLGRKP
jgi:uncharacterized protein (TIGR03086 family)